jgi:excisionase family DNA binding protein
MNSVELKLDARHRATEARESEARVSREKRGPKSSILRLVRGALDAVENERPTIEMPKDALVKVAKELGRLGTLLDEDRLWDPLDVARYLGISRNSVYSQVDAGTLPCVRIGGLLKFDPVKVRAIGKGEQRPEGKGRVTGLPVGSATKR